MAFLAYLPIYLLSGRNQLSQRQTLAGSTEGYSLIRNTSEYDVIKQGDLLSKLHGREELKTFCF